MKILFKNKSRNNLPISPPAIRVEITSDCNLKCPMRFRTHYQRPKINMTMERFKWLLDQLPQSVKMIDFTGLGENLLNKDFIEMLNYVKSKNLSIEMTDNFCFMNKEISKKILEIGINTITISIDGATKETYERIKIGSNFETIINNVENFFRLREKYNLEQPKIVFNYVINKDNIKEIFRYINLIYSLSRGKNTSISFNNIFGGWLGENRNLLLAERIPEPTIQETIEAGYKLGIPIFWPRTTISLCSNHLKPTISVTGEFMPCCVVSAKTVDAYNVFKKGFQKIFLDEKYQNFVKKKAGEIHPWCKNCSFYDTD